MRKKILICLISCFILFMLAAVFYSYTKTYHWNYTGNAVVLTADSLHEFVENTDITLDGEMYHFERTFLGDLQIGTIEAKKQFYGEPGWQKGMKTMYRYYLETNGEEYFKDRKIREKFEMKAEPAQSFWSSDIISDRKMLTFLWIEYFGDSGDLQNRAVGRFNYIEPGNNVFVVQTTEYLIVPGVSTRAGALAVLHENFDYLDWLGFEYSYRHYPYPSEFDVLLGKEEKIEQCRIPKEALSEMTVEQLVWALIDFPFLNDINVYKEQKEKINYLVESSDAFRELVSLDGPEDAIIVALKRAMILEEVSEDSGIIYWPINYGKQIGEGLEKGILQKLKSVKEIFLYCHETYFHFDETQLKYLSGEDAGEG